MATIATNGLTVYYEPPDQDAATLISQACAATERLIHQHLGLATPDDIHVYVMSSWQRFLFQAPPLYGRVLIAVAFPLWMRRVRQIWPVAGGWAIRFGRRCAIGVKPPRLLAQADKSLGDRIFYQVDDLEEKVRHITCHELTHGFTDHLKLPAWLHEGLAMIMVDRLAGQPTVKADTLARLAGASATDGPRSYRQARVTNPEAITLLYIQGYWTARYLAETQPDLLKKLLSRRYTHQALEQTIASDLGLPEETFWEAINQQIVAHYRA